MRSPPSNCGPSKAGTVPSDSDVDSNFMRRCDDSVAGLSWPRHCCQFRVQRAAGGLTPRRLSCPMMVHRRPGRKSLFARCAERMRLLGILLLRQTRSYGCRHRPPRGRLGGRGPREPQRHLRRRPGPRLGAAVPRPPGARPDRAHAALGARRRSRAPRALRGASERRGADRRRRPAARVRRDRAGEPVERHAPGPRRERRGQGARRARLPRRAARRDLERALRRGQLRRDPRDDPRE